MDYYVAGIPFSDELYHHGIKGQKWGIRRYQNEDGTLTAEGRQRYGTVENMRNQIGLEEAQARYNKSQTKTTSQIWNPVNWISKKGRQKIKDASKEEVENRKKYEEAKKKADKSEKEWMRKEHGEEIERGRKLAENGYDPFLDSYDFEQLDAQIAAKRGHPIDTSTFGKNTLDVLDRINDTLLLDIEEKRYNQRSNDYWLYKKYGID